jgi:photosystem II stability/assembly factor-like uncharacterized protein
VSMISLSLIPRPLAVAAMLSVPLAATPAQSLWTSQNSGTDASFRGMSVVNASVVWISGTGGTFAWTDDAGVKWHPGHVVGAESFDFRAVHAVSLDTVLVMVSAQDTALIYRTTDRGQSWALRYRDVSKGAFLDAMAFFDSRHGLAVGDPMDGHFVILETFDGGEHWVRQAGSAMPASLAGEGAFAASGTSLITCGSKNAWLGTGGAAKSRVFRTTDAGRTWSVAETPIRAGAAAAGIFSLACRDAQHVIAVGGNYAKPDTGAITVARSEDGGATWTASDPAPSTSFLSGVAYVNAADGRQLIAVGTEGTSLTLDSGRTWHRLDTRSLNVVMAARDGSVWAAGTRGSVATFDSSVAHKR